MPPKKSALPGHGPKKNAPKSTVAQKDAPAAKAPKSKATAASAAATAAKDAKATTGTAPKPARTTKRKAAEDKKTTTANAPNSDKENSTSSGAKANIKRKRAPSAASENGEATEADDDNDEPAAKKAKAAPKKTALKKAPAAKKAATPRAPKRAAAEKPLPVINTAPTNPFHVFVFGEGSAGELGLGSEPLDGKRPIDVKRPRLNPKLSAKEVGVVQIACGGMHVAALTRENKILTWGVNDQGALGRDTTWSGGLRDVEDEDSDDEDGPSLNPIESTPTEVDTTDIKPDTKFTQLVASDNATFALTDTGLVYGWGTFRSSEGILGFLPGTLVQRTPILLPELKNITQLAAGSNHILALDVKGKVFAWGCGQQSQLGRRVFDRDIKTSLNPKSIGNLPIRGAVAATIACGSYHSFAVDQKGRVFSWGLNNFDQLGIENQAGDGGATLIRPQLVQSLADHEVSQVAGGEHHSLACTTDGKLLVWGRVDGNQVGMTKEALTEENTIFDARGKPRILKVPTVLTEVPNASAVAAGTDHSFALTKAGKAYSWGFSTNYQTGQGTTDDIKTPTLIDNTAVRDKALVFAGAGGQYSVLASVATELVTNGV